MNPDSRFATSLVLSLLLSATNLRMAAAGRADIVVVGVRYVIGFVICFLLVGIVGRLFNGYLTQLEPDAAMAGAGGVGGPSELDDDDQAVAGADA